MGLSRRTFTKEFKLAAVQRLEQGVSMGEAARGLEVNPTCCTAGGVSFVRGRATRFRATDSGVARKAGLRNWSAGSASRRWRSGFAVRLLPLRRRRARSEPGHGVTERHSEDRAGMAQLWPAAVHRGLTAARLGPCVRKQKFVVTTDCGLGHRINGI
jgi:hypothetical protein